MKIFIVGSGKLANAILEANLSFESCEVSQWETSFKANEKSIIVHAGSGRQLPECFEFCTRTNSVFIELSTGLGTEKLTSAFPIIICPNTSVLVLKTLLMVKAFGKNFAGYDISITESHQASKESEPGTAYTIAEALKFPIREIASIRNPEVQRHQINIPHEYLSKHAYHRIEIRDGKDQVTIETKVLGHQSYANGVRKIVDAVLKHPLENGVYTVLNLIERGLIE